MDFYKNDYYGLIKSQDGSALYACSLVLINGDEIFAYLREIDHGVFYLQDPLILIRSIDPERGTPVFMFKKYNGFSDDTTMILKDASILTIGFLSDDYLALYKESIDSINKKMKNFKVGKQLLNEAQEDEYLKQLELAKKPTLLN